jgi:nitroreductase
MDPRLGIIYSRRSIRRYQNKLMPRETLDELLHAAMAAPSAHDNRPWEFVVITDAAVRLQIREHHPYARFANEASAVILVFGDADKPLMEQTLAAATENILLAATGLGLGAVWCGMTDERQAGIRELVGIPEHKRIVSLVCVGYPSEEKDARTNYDPARVHWEKYTPAE